MSFQIVIEGANRAFSCDAREAVLQRMVVCGGRELLVGCRGGGCGVCRVEVLAGEYHTGCMSRRQISSEDEARRVVLACQLFPRSNLRLRAVGRLVAAVAERPRRASL